MMKILKSLEKKNTEGTPSIGNGEQHITPLYLLSFTPPLSQTLNYNGQGAIVSSGMYSNSPVLQYAVNP